MRLLAILASAALFAATAAAAPATLDDGTASVRSSSGLVSGRTGAGPSADATTNEAEGEDDGERENDERDDDDRLAEVVLRPRTDVAHGGSLALRRRSPAHAASAGRDPQSDLGRPPRA